MIEEIAKLERWKEKAIEVYAKLEDRLDSGIITRQHYDEYIAKVFQGKTKKEIIQDVNNRIEAIRRRSLRSRNEFTTTTIILLIILGTLFLFTGENRITGFATYNKLTDYNMTFNQTFTKTTIISLNETNISSLKVTGSHLLQGHIAIYIEDNTQSINAYEWTEPIQDNYSVSTEKKEYLPGEEINVNITPENTSYSLYLYGDNSSSLINNTFTINQTGNYTLKAIFNDSGNIEMRTTNFSVVNNITNTTTHNNETTAYLSGYCGQACNINPPLKKNIKLKIIVENSEFNLERIEYQSKIDNAPVQIANIPTIIFSNHTEINLSDYFEDPDRDPLHYDISNIIGVREKINKTMLILDSDTPGKYSAKVYVNDLEKMIESNTFKIIVKDKNIGGTNTTPQNQTPPTTNNTNQTPENPNLYKCLAKNKNARPSYCFTGKEKEYFDNNKYPLVNPAGQLAGTIMPNGDLKIKGIVIENTNEIPGEYSFEIKNSKGEPTIWIDPINGNLYLRGNIYNNQETMSWSSRFDFIIKNTKGIYLAVFDAEGGNLYLRGGIKNE